MSAKLKPSSKNIVIITVHAKRIASSSFDQLWEHKWMKKHEGKYKINMQSYVYRKKSFMPDSVLDISATT